MDDPGLHKLKKMYEKLNYFDQYGGSVILFIIITILIILFASYCKIMANTTNYRRLAEPTMQTQHYSICWINNTSRRCICERLYPAKFHVLHTKYTIKHYGRGYSHTQ